MRPGSGREDLQMRQGHLPYGYRISDGTAVIDQEQAEQVRGIFEAYLSGRGYVDAARSMGLDMYHGSVKRMLQNRHYLGDDFYPAIIDRETFNSAEEERLRRVELLGRKWDKMPEAERPIPASFYIGTVPLRYGDPYKQAAYVYSLIESGD